MRKIVYVLVGALLLFGCKDDDEALLRPEAPQGGGGVVTQGDLIRLTSSKNFVQGDSVFVLTAALAEGETAASTVTLPLKVMRNYNGEDVDQKTLFENFPTELTIAAGQNSVTSDTIKVKQNEEKTQEFEVKVSTVVEGYSIQPSPLILLMQYTKKEVIGGGGTLTDEVKVYDDPDKAIFEYDGFGPGSDHPNTELAKNWKFYTAHEFISDDHWASGAPYGFADQKTGTVEGQVLVVDNGACSDVIKKDNHEKDGYLRMITIHLDEPINNMNGASVNYKTAAFYENRPGQNPHWCKFQEGMRIEVRMRRTSHPNFNYAVWFMGMSNLGGVSWPKCGEIDLVESPFFGQAFQTLHSESGAPTSGSINVADQGKWNIYWMEWLNTGIKMGVNDQTYFTQDNTSSDWNTWLVNEGGGPNSGGFYMILTTGLGATWAGGMPAYDLDPLNLPSMDIDWIRVWQNKSAVLNPAEAPKTKGPRAGYWWKPRD